MKLKRLEEDAKQFLDEEFLSGEKGEISKATYTDFISDIDLEIGLNELSKQIDEIIDRHDKYDRDIDLKLAPTIHSCLTIPRRLASDPGIWRYLSVVEFPELIWHRWEYREHSDWSKDKKHFWKLGIRPESNYYARLWWVAELTFKDDGDYSSTKKAFESQSIANRLFSTNLSFHKPAATAFIDRVSEVQVEPVKVLKRLRSKISTYVLETLTYDQVRDMINEILYDLKNNKSEL